VKKVAVISLALVLVLCMFISGCGTSGPTVPTKVLLGTVLPVTGIFSGFGQQQFGMQKAVDDWNAAYGGMYLSDWNVTVPVELVVKNCESDFSKVGPLATTLATTNKVNAFIAPNAPCGLHDPISVVSDSNQVPEIICGGPFEPWYFGMRSGVAGNWPYAWFAGFSIAMPQTAPRDVPGYTMVDSWFSYMDAVGAHNNTNSIVGIFASSDADGIGWWNTFTPVLQAHNYTVVNLTAGLFTIGTTDFSSLIDGWEAANVTIIWGNCPGSDFGNLYSACYAHTPTPFRPKIVLAARAALFPVDVSSWGTSPPLGYGVGCEQWWSANYTWANGFQGIGNRTAASLAADFTAQAGNPPLNLAIGSGYMGVQVMLDAIHRAGNLNATDINAALATTDLNTIDGWVSFNSTTHFSAVPLAFGQWFFDNVTSSFTYYTTASTLGIIPTQQAPLFPVDTLYP
jgi:ABC-type branched-subunit amino acid transport system substrate-binding protein